MLGSKIEIDMLSKIEIDMLDPHSAFEIKFENM